MAGLGEQEKMNRECSCAGGTDDEAGGESIQLLNVFVVCQSKDDEEPAGLVEDCLVLFIKHHMTYSGTKPG